MRAAILAELGKPLIVDDVEVPAPGHGQVLVQVRYSGLCGAQLNEIDGVKGKDAFLPHLLGHEGSGVVLEAGPGVRAVAPGDHVVMHWRPGQGNQSETPAYRWRGRRLNAGWVTTFNERAVVSENRVTRIPKDFDLSLAPLFGCAVTSGFGVINNDAEVKIGESVVVLGAGGVGLCELQAAAMVAAYPIVAVDLFDHKLELAKRFGATHAVKSGGGKEREEILALVGGDGADVVIDNTGNPRVIELAYALTRPQGRTILVGVPRLGDNVSIYSLPLHFGKVLTGSHGGGSRPAEDIPRYVRLCRGGKLDLSRLFTERFGLEDINRAVERLRTGAIAGRALIEVSP